MGLWSWIRALGQPSYWLLYGRHPMKALVGRYYSLRGAERARARDLASRPERQMNYYSIHHPNH